MEPQPIGGRAPRLRVVNSEGQRALFFGTEPVQIYELGDRAAGAAGLALLARAGVAPRTELAEVFNCHRNTVTRLERRMERSGMAAVVPSKRDPKGPHKVTPAVLAVVAANATQSCHQVTQLIAEETGVRLHPNHVGRLLRTVRQGLPGPELWEEDAAASSASPNVMAESQSAGPAVSDPGAALVVTRTREEQEAPEAWDPPAVVPMVARGRYMGTAL